ncbi:MAG: hypothetical protein IPP78_14600 [Holophagaceae bacterium]|nr:hypothetical protein [Holophagaceae bacterium]
MTKRYAVTQGSGRGWSVHPEGEAGNLVKHVPYALACAIARHLNGHDPEAGDYEALVSFALGNRGDAP